MVCFWLFLFVSIGFYASQLFLILCVFGRRFVAKQESEGQAMLQERSSLLPFPVQSRVVREKEIKLSRLGIHHVHVCRRIIGRRR